MTVLYIITFLFLILSWIKDRKKTKKALKIAYHKFMKVLHPFLLMLIAVSFSLALIPNAWIEKTLAGSQFTAVFLGSLFGSVVMLPGFVAFPLAAILKDSGVGYGTLAAFTTTLMMVGILTFPVEKAYIGTRLAVTRNLIGYGIAMITAFVIAAAFGEVFI